MKKMGTEENKVEYQSEIHAAADRTEKSEDNQRERGNTNRKEKVC